ncbi:S8 family peptidase [Kurthia sibirica]|uniref:Uncharacterized protein n=1 Tax=Kurthia sibirica TaxID=202750 RepID=A0A2U3AGC8_9BACL|nr:S8 family serine peptidase [Kurthia sibirica]PWI23554.1 hypothetical protein DEX24_16080 [Kurthia sibirica]GEK35408.1 hypothetical protein KSI01_29410 [Kurthia sibirica]
MKILLTKIASLIVATTIITTPISAILADATPASKAQKIMPTMQKEPAYTQNKLVIKYNSPLSFKEIAEVKGSIVQQLPALNYVIVQFKNEDDFRQAVSLLSTNDKITNLALSPQYTTMATPDLKDHNQYIHSKLQTKKAYRDSGMKKVKVAVIDTGIDDTNPDLKGKIVFQKNIMDPMKKSVKSAHGTHVAGIIAANYRNEIGGFGVYPNAQIYAYDVFNGSANTNDYNLANAIIQAVKSGVQLINISIGGTEPSIILQDAINYATKKNVVIVAAAGNESTSEPSYPASFDNVINIGSTNDKNKLSSFSNYGPSIDLVAPGEDIYSTSYTPNRSSYFEYMSGTSMASPVATGIIAMLLSKNKQLTPAQVNYILQHTAKDLGPKGTDFTYGAGLIQPVAALKFNPKKIPSLVSTNWTKATILTKASKLSLHSTVAGKLTKPSEQHWRKVSVKKGQLIQAKLVPSEHSDLKLSLRFYGKNTSKSYSIDHMTAGGSEAKYVKAPFDGQLAVGVKDVFGNANGSYKLSMQSPTTFPTDESSMDKPMTISSSTSSINKLYMQPKSTSSDQDVFHFSASKNQLMQFETTALPGVDLSLEVYTKNNLYGDGEDGPIASINKNGIGEAEHLSFTTQKGEDYYVIVSNAPNSLAVTPDDLLGSLTGGLSKPQASLLPYNLHISSKNIPVDEDRIYFDNATMAKVDRDAPTKSYSLEQLVKKAGRPFDIKNGVKGYLQGSNDIDGYYFKTKKSGFYEFASLVKNDNDQPALSIYAVIKDPKTGDVSEQLIASNVTDDGMMNDTAIASLAANTTYLVELSVGPIGSIPFNGYKATAKILSENIADRYENNDEPEKAKSIQVKKNITANFSSPNDVDFYYFTAPTSGIYGIDLASDYVDTSAFSTQWLNYYTKNISIFKDYNGNHKMDTKDMESVVSLAIDKTGEAINGSIEAKKGEKFFILANPTGFVTTSLFSIFPYTMRITPAKMIDEDAGNKVKNNTPSKAIKLINTDDYLYSKTGILNPGQLHGDVDWYSLKSKYKKTVTVSLQVPDDMDGVVEIYKKGKLVKKLDSYGKGDYEIAKLTMTKGIYYFKVRDRDGNAFIHPYELEIEYD